MRLWFMTQDDAISYARHRAQDGGGIIRVYNALGDLESEETVGAFRFAKEITSRHECKEGENAASPAGPKSTPTTSDRSADKPGADTAPPPEVDGQKEQPSTGKSERVEATSKVKQGSQETATCFLYQINWEKWAVLVLAVAGVIVAFAGANRCREDRRGRGESGSGQHRAHEGNVTAWATGLGWGCGN